MHNLGTVIRFEIIRTLKKKSFWIMALGFPVMIAAIFAIVFFANKATDDAAKNMQNQFFSVAITDNSGLIKPELAASLKATSASSKQAGIDAVRSGQKDAYFYYPADLKNEPIEVFGRDVGIFDNSRYESVAKYLLSQSVESSLDSTVVAVVKGETSSNFVAFKNGQEYDGFRQMILPGIFLILFYFLIAFFGNQMLTSTTEEKENRVIEMILTTIEARTLIIGKIISLIALALIQACIVLIPVIIGYLLLHNQLSLPSLDLTSLPVNWTRIGIGFAVFSASFLLFTGLLVAIGAATPTAKEAGGFFGIVMMLIFGPLYAASLFVSAPDSPIVQILSYFPFTAPIPLMLRNAVGNLGYGEAFIAISVLILTAAIVMVIAVRVFRYGALEYSRKVSLREIFTRKG